jgi:hypothetical protein
MGKQQQTKKKQDRREARHNPVRVPDSHLGQGAGSAKAHPAKEQALLPIIDKVSPVSHFVYPKLGDAKLDQR